LKHSANSAVETAKVNSSPLEYTHSTALQIV